MRRASEPWEWRSRFGGGVAHVFALGAWAVVGPPCGSEPWRRRSRSFMRVDATEKAEGVTVRLSAPSIGKPHQSGKGRLVYASA